MNGLEQLCASDADKVPVAPIVALDRFTQAPVKSFRSHLFDMFGLYTVVEFTH